MRSTNRILRTFALTALVAGVPLCAQNIDSVQNMDADILAAQTGRSPQTLEKRAEELEASYQFESAQKLLDAALVLRGQVNGDQSADYGLCLLKLGALERKAGRAKEASAHYATAVRLLPGRPETARVFLFLGVGNLSRKDVSLATENLQRARSLDLSLSGPVLMWTGLMQERHAQPDLAEASYKAALAEEAPDSLEAFETLTLYARFLQEHGRDAEAQEAQARITVFRNAHRPPYPAPTRTSAPAAAPVATMPTGGTYRVGGGVSQPMVLLKVDPSYSEEARVAKYSATVLLQLVVGADGLPHKIQVVKRAGFGLDDCAIATIAKWKFKPGEKNGSPVDVYANIEVNFRLL